MYYILLCEALTSAFMKAEGGKLLEQLDKQAQNTIKAMFPTGELDKHLRYFFEAAVMAESEISRMSELVDWAVL